MTKPEFPNRTIDEIYLWLMWAVFVAWIAVFVTACGDNIVPEPEHKPTCVELGCEHVLCSGTGSSAVCKCMGEECEQTANPPPPEPPNTQGLDCVSDLGCDPDMITCDASGACACDPDGSGTWIRCNP